MPTDILPTLPTVAIPGVSLMLPGTYTGVRGGTNTYSDTDLDGAVQAFQELRNVFTPKAKIGHNTKQALLAADEEPSAGDITNVYRRGRELVVDTDKVPGKLAQLIKAGAYGNRSAEFLMNATFNGKTYPLVLKGFAWLGATAPAVAGLSDITALYSRAEETALAEAGGETVIVLLAANHDPFDGTHSHPHTAAGTQGGDETHDHEHAHGEGGEPDADHTPDAAHVHGAAADLAAPTKSEGAAGSFGKGDYAYTPSDSPSDWKLRLTKTPGGDPDAGIVGAAAAALGPGFRGQKVDIPAADRPAVVAKVRTAWKKANPDKKDADMPDALQSEAQHSRGGLLALLGRLVKGQGTVADVVALAADAPDLATEMTDAQLAAQAIAIINQLLARESSQIDADDDEADDIRLLLCVRDQLKQFAAGEAAEGLGVAGSSGMGYYAAADDPIAGMSAALETFKGHMDAIGKGKKGVGMARYAHRMLSGYVKALGAGGLVTDGNTGSDEGPDGERGNELKGGIQTAHSRQEDETVNDSELRALLGVDDTADLKQAVLKLKGQSVELSAFEEVRGQLAELARKDNEREATLLVERAIDAHKLNAAQRDWALNYAMRDRADFEEVFLAAAPATAWPAGEVGSSSDNATAPKPLTPLVLEVASRMDVSQDDLQAHQEKPFQQRVLEARQQAAANAGKRK